MKKYYIYHIPNVKVGCSTEPDKRVSDQGYKEYDILDITPCMDEADDLEVFWQKHLGYKVDRNPYSLSKSNRRVWNDDDRRKSTATLKKRGFFKTWYKKGNAARIRGCIALDKQTEKPVKYFNSISDAARWVNKEGKTSVISACCKGKKPSIYGYKWKYTD